MKKAIRILAISVIALAAVSMFLLLTLFILQIPLCALHGYQTEMFFYPLSDICSTFSLLLLGVGLLVTTKCTIWSDILLLAAQLTAVPVCSFILSFLDLLITDAMVYARESIYQRAHSLLTGLCATPTGLTALGSTLLLVACGMSLVYKCMNQPSPASEEQA